MGGDDGGMNDCNNNCILGNDRDDGDNGDDCLQYGGDNYMLHLIYDRDNAFCVLLLLSLLLLRFGCKCKNVITK